MEKIKAQLTQDLHQFLMEKGYTHVNLLGASEVNSKENGKFDFVMEALKKNELDLAKQNTDAFIDEMGSPEILEMALGDEFMNFVVEIPVQEYEEYLQS